MKNHYDVCLAGFWYGKNYGSILNGYAEYCLLKEFGKKVLMLFKPGVDSSDPEIKSGHNIDFFSKYYDVDDITPPLPYSELHKLNDICDCFCAGSDQIWNYYISFHENLYLPFVNDDKKLISFATSFGDKIDNIPNDAKPRIKRYLSRYDAISVREQFDADILKYGYGLESTVVFEPVFCISQTYYQKLVENSKFDESEPYLLLTYSILHQKREMRY